MSILKLEGYMPSEFSSEDSFDKIFNDHELMMGRMICGSKSLYRQTYPDHKVVFNANIVIRSKGKIWYGDLDLTLDREKLKKIAEKLNEPLYVLYEMDARFENEDKPFKFYKNKAVEVINFK